MDALILAGGENTRIPFTKGLLEIQGRKIIDRNIELLKNIFKRVIISTNNPELYFYTGVPMVGDLFGFRGPMTGIFSAFAAFGSADIFVTACDMPFINAILIQYILGRWGGGYDAAIPVYDGKPQPLFGIYSRGAAEKMERNIIYGRRSLREFLRGINVMYINENEVRTIDTEGKSFVNINTLDDYQREGGRVCSV